MNSQSCICCDSIIFFAFNLPNCISAFLWFGSQVRILEKKKKKDLIKIENKTKRIKIDLTSCVSLFLCSINSPTQIH